MQRCVANTKDMVNVGNSVNYPIPFILSYLDLSLSKAVFKGKYPSYIIPHVDQHKGRVQWGIQVKENIWVYA